MNKKRSDVIVNFKKAHSVLVKLIKMTKDGQYGVKIMQQKLAAIGLLNERCSQKNDGGII